MKITADGDRNFHSAGVRIAYRLPLVVHSSYRLSVIRKQGSLSTSDVDDSLAASCMHTNAGHQVLDPEIVGRRFESYRHHPLMTNFEYRNRSRTVFGSLVRRELM
jgi:hypothetical protein